MIDYNQDAIFAAHRDRQSRLIAEATAQRQAEALQGYRPALHHHLLTKAGDLLIAAGTTLKARVDPIPAPPEFGGSAERP
jgi:hypothetical protein